MGVEKQRSIERSNSKGKSKKVVLGGADAPTGDKAYWYDVDPEWLGQVLALVQSAGAAVMCTTTRDGGALGFRFYHDVVEAKTYYFRPDDAVSMAKIQEVVNELVTLAHG